MAKKIIAAALAAAAIFTGIACWCSASLVPDSIHAIHGQEPRLDRASYIRFSIDDDQAVETGGAPGGECTAWASLWGIIPIKSVHVRFVERESVELCGVPIGIRINTDGVIVAETTQVLTGSGSVNPGRQCGLEAGDRIISVDGQPVTEAMQLIDAVEHSDGRVLRLEVVRQSGERASLELQPAYSQSDGCYRAGIWIRSSTAGIGVLTYYDRNSGMFGGLGHAICDETSGAVMTVSEGEITSVMLTEIVRGASGAPGELVGFLGDEVYGRLTRNTETGVYGYIDNDFSYGQGEYEVALKQEIEEGAAQIVTAVPGSDGIKRYDISIEKINYDEDTPTRNMIVKVTDEELLELTGGIVQGMSGSPIVQNGRIVGAVTHVLVNDPTSGYGIFIENMLNAAA